MKKIAVFVLAAMAAVSAFAAYGPDGNSWRSGMNYTYVSVNGVWFQGSEAANEYPPRTQVFCNGDSSTPVITTTGGSFANHDFGVIQSLAIGGLAEIWFQIQTSPEYDYWNDGISLDALSDYNDFTMSYSIDGQDETRIGGMSLVYGSNVYDSEVVDFNTSYAAVTDTV